MKLEYQLIVPEVVVAPKVTIPAPQSVSEMLSVMVGRSLTVIANVEGYPSPQEL